MRGPLSLFLLLVSLPASGLALEWSPLPPIPDREGFAGSFAGEVAGALVVAGGANFPDRKPWEGGIKRWYDQIFVLERGAEGWREEGKLPAVSGYGASVQLEEGLLLVGGGDGAANHAAVRLLRREDRTVRFESWPDLPLPLAMCAATRVGRTVYVAGGVDRPDATTAQRVFLALDLDRRAVGWCRLETWPGPERILAGAGECQGEFFLFSGARLFTGTDGKVAREWLRDAYAFTPGQGWRRLPDLPRVAVGVPSPVPTVEGKLWVLGGDDGTQVQVAPTAHRGFRRDILAFDPAANTWTVAGDMPFALVTTATARWQGRVIVPGGERLPGTRSTAVWAGKSQ